MTIQMPKEKLLGDLEKLIELGKAVAASEVMNGFGYSYNQSLESSWEASCISFLSKTCGEKNHCHSMFASVTVHSPPLGRNLRRAQGILLGAKHDLESGALTDTKTLVQAEVFSNLLE